MEVLGRSCQQLAKPGANLRHGRHRAGTGRHWLADGGSSSIFLKNWARFPFLAKTGLFFEWFGVLLCVLFLVCFSEAFWEPIGVPKGSQHGAKMRKKCSKEGPRTLPKEGPEKSRFFIVFRRVQDLEN